jgi:hypothetical protein
MPILFYRPYHHYWLQLLPLGLILIGVNFGHKKWWQRWQPFLVTGVAGWFVLSYTGIGQYYLTDQLDYLGSLSCKEIDHPAGYFVTDCVPNKYFYTIDSR